MNAVVIYESMTGNTEKAARLIGGQLELRGLGVTVCPASDVNFQALADAELVIVGSWTDGMFFFGQKPARAGRLANLPYMTGKRCAVFCTYALDTGKTLDKLSAIMRGRGADVIGGYAIKRNELEDGSVEFVERLLGIVAV